MYSMFGEAEMGGKIAVAEKMIKAGEPASKIQDYTELTMKKLQSIAKKLNVALVI